MSVHTNAASTIGVGGSITTAKNTLSSPAFSSAVLRQFGGNDRARSATMTDHSLVVGISLINKTSDGSCELTHGILPFYDAESDQFVGNLSTRATKAYEYGTRTDACKWQ